MNQIHIRDSIIRSLLLGGVALLCFCGAQLIISGVWGGFEVAVAKAGLVLLVVCVIAQELGWRHRRHERLRYPPMPPNAHRY